MSKLIGRRIVDPSQLGELADSPRKKSISYVLRALVATRHSPASQLADEETCKHHIAQEQGHFVLFFTPITFVAATPTTCDGTDRAL